MKKILKPILLAIVFISCNSDSIFSDRTSMPDMVWERKNIVEFFPEITIDSIAYDLVMPIRYIDGYPYQNLKFQVGIFSEETNSVVLKKEFNIDIRDKQSFKYFGDGSGDYWDLDISIETNYSFPDKGKYKVQISHLMSEDGIPLIDDIGFNIVKSTKE